tara:strand:+ start:109 stop:744 length:636 start_codon:yes stop_codon:yes gene_type:complete
MDALILAAGLGTRMEDLIEKIPKPLLKINDKPLISYTLDLIFELPFENIYVNTHYKADILKTYLSDKYPRVKISYEEKILGTGGGIKRIQEKDLFIINTDNLWQHSFCKEIEKAIVYFSDHNEIENMLLVNSHFGEFDLEVNDNIIKFPSKNKNTRFQGCHFLRNNCLSEYPDIFDIPSYWINCSREKKLFGYNTTTNNPHIGTKELYLQY